MGAGYLLAQEWAALMLSLALAAVRKFMVTELQWLTLVSKQWALWVVESSWLMERWMMDGWIDGEVDDGWLN